MKTMAVYDDTGRIGEVIADIIGDRGFADVVVRKRRLEEHYHDALNTVFPDLIWKKVQRQFEYEGLLKELEFYEGQGVRVLHCFSNYLIADAGLAGLSFEKLRYVDEPFAALEKKQEAREGTDRAAAASQDRRPAAVSGAAAGGGFAASDRKRAVAVLFPDLESYAAFLRMILSGRKAWDIAREMEESFEMEGLIDIGITSNFIQCLTGDFDSRYFNSLSGNEYTIEKRSRDKKKIRAEYDFYHLLPEDMKYWFVLPFNYREEEDYASYTMERLHMTDLAIKWVHGSMGREEFSTLMEQYFYFFRCRHVRECGEEAYQRTADALYVDKVRSRIETLKQHPEYPRIAALLAAAETGAEETTESGSEAGVVPDARPAAGKGAVKSSAEAGHDASDAQPAKRDTLDALAEKYFDLKKRVEARCTYPLEQVIGHGDPCFANAMYNKSTRTLKFIDPKGASSEEDLWTNPYYDIAKLSHSVCGRYDFFNNGLFEIKLSEDLFWSLEIPFDNSEYMELFREKVEENGFDFLTVRLYEASLFLSMLPLHMDNPHKVFGFILNAKTILEEIEEHV